MIYLKFKKDAPDVEVPAYAHDGDVGMDFKAISCVYNEEYDYYEYDTGLIFESGRETAILAFPRSGNSKTDAYLCNAVGVVDSFIYRGHVKLRFKNRTSLDQLMTNEINYRLINALCQGKKPNVAQTYEDVKNEMLERARKLEFAPYKVGAYVAQMIGVRCETMVLEEGELVMDTVRGANGFGSTH